MGGVSKNTRVAIKRDTDLQALSDVTQDPLDHLQIGRQAEFAMGVESVQGFGARIYGAKPTVSQSVSHQEQELIRGFHECPRFDRQLAKPYPGSHDR
jgi:hypothetical protein